MLVSLYRMATSLPKQILEKNAGLQVQTGSSLAYLI
jgi:hypothetical protein